MSFQIKNFSSNDENFSIGFMENPLMCSITIIPDEHKMMRANIQFYHPTIDLFYAELIIKNIDEVKQFYEKRGLTLHKINEKELFGICINDANIEIKNKNGDNVWVHDIKIQKTVEHENVIVEVSIGADINFIESDKENLFKLGYSLIETKQDQ